MLTLIADMKLKLPRPHIYDSLLVWNQPGFGQFPTNLIRIWGDTSHPLHVPVTGTHCCERDDRQLQDVTYNPGAGGKKPCNNPSEVEYVPRGPRAEQVGQLVLLE